MAISLFIVPSDVYHNQDNISGAIFLAVDYLGILPVMLNGLHVLATTDMLRVSPEVKALLSSYRNVFQSTSSLSHIHFAAVLTQICKTPLFLGTGSFGIESVI